MDETYIKVKSQWKYLYRAVDSDGNTVEFLLTDHRDNKAALRFFKKAMRQHGQPEVVMLDKSGANKAAVDELNQGKSTDEAIIIRQNNYLNNLIEQDHPCVKRRTRPIEVNP
ncbi:DDE domain-containing protein [Xenorhabdus koppenhoeferi]|uniref:DDE domain-containing protein n=1 Tax=Xenorhabdus koppenhoeferi TaxID=351659 RepID=A0A1I7JTX4_9GAMM|nr:DDE domain-containing protein [Xenorhabdus koppenhoeferi]